MTDVSADTNEQLELKQALVSAQTIEETLKVFNEMESSFKEMELGKACFVVAQKLYTFGHADVDQVLDIAKRALTILTATKDPILLVAMIYQWVGNVYFLIERFQDCLVFFELASKKLQAELDNEDDSYNRGDFKVLDMFLDVEQKLCIVTERFNMIQAVVVHTKKVLELKEKVLGDGCFEVGKANKKVYKALLKVGDMGGAFPYCGKALEIYKKHFGEESLEVGKVMLHLGLVYSETKELEKAFEINQSAVRVFKKVAPNTGLLIAAEARSGDVLIELGRCKEAVDIFRRLVTYNDVTKNVKINLLVSLTNALCCLERFGEAKKHLKVVQKIFDRKEVDAQTVAIGCGDVSLNYERMKDFESAISWLKRGLELPELPQTLITTYFTRFFKLMCLSGKQEEGILYMLGFVTKLKKSCGSENHVVGLVYAQLGAAYSKSGRKELAAKALRIAKDIVDVSSGPRDLTSLKISHNLSVALAELKRYVEALEIEEDVAKGVEGLPQSELGFVHEVHTHLSTMRERVAESPTTASSQSKDEGSLSAKMASSNISDDVEGPK